MSGLRFWSFGPFILVWHSRTTWERLRALLKVRP